MSTTRLTNKHHNQSTPEWVTHALNNSKAKLAYSFQKSSRFIPEKSCSPNKFYDLPSSFSNRSLSPQHTLRTSIQKDTSLGGWGHNLSTSLDFKRGRLERSNTTFGIGRQDYYKGRSDQSKLGPGSYDVRSSMQNKFYMGRKVQPIYDKNKPDCTTYNVTAQSYSKLSKNKNGGAYKMKVQYYPKNLLQPYDNKIPGPGSYQQKGIADSTKNKSYKQNYNRKKTNSSFGIGQRMKIQYTPTPAPDYYNRFSEFGKPKY